MDEFSWITSLRAELDGGLPLLWGIGDDAAVLQPLEASRVIATDLLVEGVHFRRDWSTLEDIAFKLYASNASDMWAMGARPVEWLLTVAWPQRPDEEDARALRRGFQDAMAMWGTAPLIGGDTSTSQGALMLSVTMLGELYGEPWCRSGFVPGDRLWVDGPLGLAAAGLAELQAFGADADRGSPCVRQQRRPQRLPAATQFHARGAIDISDGLSVDLQHAAEASGVRMVLDQPLPGGPALEEAARRLKTKPSRSEERRVGKECRSRWSPCHEKKKE